MRLKFILSKNLELFYLRFLCVKVFPFVVHVAERGFPEVADWLTVQWSFLVMSWEANRWVLVDELSQSPLLVEV